MDNDFILNKAAQYIKMTKVFDNIATFLAESPEWVENWVSTPVKKMTEGSICQIQPKLDFPEFVVSLFNSLSIEQFNRSLKLNRDWYKECKRELENRRKACIKKYWKTVEEYKEAKMALNNCWENGVNDEASTEYFYQCGVKREELVEERMSIFANWVDVDKACLNCGFRNLIDHENPKYYIDIYNWGMDPYKNPTQDEIDAWNRGDIEELEIGGTNLWWPLNP